MAEKAADEDLPQDSGRIRTLTEKGEAMYRENRDRFLSQLEVARSSLEDLIQDVEDGFPKSAINIANAERDLQVTSARFSHCYEQCVDFLSRHITEEEKRDREELLSSSKIKNVKKRLSTLFDRLSAAKDVKDPHISEEAMSQGSGSSRRSLRSTSEIAARKRAEEAAARVSLEFLRRELKLKEQLELLTHEKELATKKAEADYLEGQSQPEKLDLPTANIQERTRQYVLGHAEDDSKDERTDLDAEEHQTKTTNSDIAKYLCRKDIIKDRIQTFNGKHEHYLSWKDTFQSVMLEIEANPAEELDLLLKWGGCASNQINSIKTANSGNARLGLTRAWERLDAQFGAPEKVDLALRTKLAKFPRITIKDKGKMYELSDILSEIRAVKEKPAYTALLGYLDTPTGVNPTIGKLPYILQNKWRDRALSYKRSNKVLFPPFTYFCDFVHEMAIAFNDPSFDFSLTGAEENETRPNRPRQLSVAKTSTDDAKSSSCVIHNGKHSINECRSSRHKTLDERRQLLMRHGICFRCCAERHLSKDCTQSVACAECGNSKHCTAMHVY